MIYLMKRISIAVQDWGEGGGRGGGDVVVVLSTRQIPRNDFDILIF